jgi:ribosomal protein S18 acetylase RimI-like enzyme
MEIFETKEITDEIVEAWKCLMPQLSASSPVPTREQLQALLDARSVVLLMAREDGKLVGSLSLAYFRVPTGVRGWIEDVVVDESMRGRGIGEGLTRRALEIAKELGIKTVDLTSRPSREAANRLYQRVGFKARQTNLYRYTITEE